MGAKTPEGDRKRVAATLRKLTGPRVAEITKLMFTGRIFGARHPTPTHFVGPSELLEDAENYLNTLTRKHD